MYGEYILCRVPLFILTYHSLELVFFIRKLKERLVATEMPRLN